MAMLADAKKGKEEKPKKKKVSPPAAQSPSVPDNDNETGESGADASDQDNPNASTSDSGSETDSESAGAAPNPQAPQGGEGDDAEPQGDSDDVPNPAGDSDGGAQGNTPDIPDAGSQPSAGSPGGQIPLPQGLKEAYQRANVALMTALYQSPQDKVAQSILGGIQDNPQYLIGSVVHMSAILFTQINKQLKFIKSTPQIVLPFAKDVVAHVIDLAVQVKQLQITPQQEQAALGGMLETVMRMTGVSKDQANALKNHLGQDAVDQGAAKYKAHLAAVKGANGGGAPTPGNQAPAQGGPPANGVPPGAGGPGAAPAGAQGAPPPNPEQGGGQPQPGSPVTAAPGPGQSAPPGGMLSQAAAQPPQGA